MRIRLWNSGPALRARRFVYAAACTAPLCLALSVSAQTTAANAPGVTVAPPATAPGPTPDQKLGLTIYRAFYADPRIGSAFTQVQVTNGVATLSGSVHSEAARQAAGEVAAKTPGVVRVINSLEIKPHLEHSDEKIYRNVRHAVGTDPQVNCFNIQVGVVNGRVYLAGPVATVFARSKIANLAAAVPGVTGVANALSVPQGYHLYDRWPPGGFYPHTKCPSDKHLRKQITQELLTSPYLDARQIQIEVKDRVATLSGTVGSEAERDVAVHQAYQSGARLVEDALAVLPPMVAAQE
jgi:osmotically-inducible protein OsmY